MKLVVKSLGNIVEFESETFDMMKHLTNDAATGIGKLHLHVLICHIVRIEAVADYFDLCDFS